MVNGSRCPPPNKLLTLVQIGKSRGWPVLPSLSLSYFKCLDEHRDGEEGGSFALLEREISEGSSKKDLNENLAKLI